LTWLSVLAVTVVVVALVALVGVRPSGGRPVERTQLMTVGRIVLLVLGLAIAYVAFGR
jgi:uncharacterized membrane protein YozB (DUF420 family)